MNGYDVFGPDDLVKLEKLYESADAVVAMEDVWLHGKASDHTIGLRHDVDHSPENAVKMALWEAKRGFRSTYFLLHSAPYWQEKSRLRWAINTIGELGHEIGFHVNAIGEAIRNGRDPIEIADEALSELRQYGWPIRGVAAHGDPLCRNAGKLRFVNDEIFQESPRPEVGLPDRVIEGTQVKLEPISRHRMGLDYDPNWLPRSDYLSDSGGNWSQPFEVVADRFRHGGRLHMLVHADWWGKAFSW